MDLKQARSLAKESEQKTRQFLIENGLTVPSNLEDLIQDTKYWLYKELVFDAFRFQKQREIFPPKPSSQSLTTRTFVPTEYADSYFGITAKESDNALVMDWAKKLPPPSSVSKELSELTTPAFSSLHPRPQTRSFAKLSRSEAFSKHSSLQEPRPPTWSRIAPKHRVTKARSKGIE